VRGARGERRIQKSERGEMVRWAKGVHITIKEAMRVRASDEGESSERSKRRETRDEGAVKCFEVFCGVLQCYTFLRF
jgi:hypothetical protein